MSNYEWIKDLKQGDTVYHCRGQKLPIVSAYPEEMLPVVKGCFVEFVATSKRVGH